MTDYQIEQLCTIINEIEFCKCVSENVILNVYNFLKFLLIKNLIDSSKQVILIQKNKNISIILNSIFSIKLCNMI